MATTVLAAALLAVATGQAALADLTASVTATSRVIVSAVDSTTAHLKTANVNGHVAADLPVAGAVVADVTSGQQALLAADPTVTITQNAPVQVNAVASTTTTTRPPAAVYPQQTGASQLVASGVSGQGVSVAVIDTGIDNLPDFAGRLVGGIDLSGEGNPWQDSYGHGTFVAGLIAGNGASSGGAYVGEAPGAGLVSIKVAGASGSTDLATVLTGVQWAVTNQKTFGIGVMNLSLGVVPTQSTVLNPLDRAVEAAWNAGVTVVASAGNAGPFNGTILSPGDDPQVITVGALDDLGQTNPVSDAMTTFSSVGPTNPDGWAKPDLVTSGRSLVSLRAPGSTVDTLYPSARIGTSNFVGSGTSFSAAITSGAAALIQSATKAFLQPTEVKGRLLAYTNPGPVGNPFVDGHGALNAYAAATNSKMVLSIPAPTTATAVGATVSLSAGPSWNGSSWNSSSWSGGSWNGSAWNGSAWNGSAWNGSAWNGSAWNGSAWNGSAWNGSAWNGSAWNGSAWNGSAWNGSAWNGSAWNGSAWNGSAWNGSAWNGSAWN